MKRCQNCRRKVDASDRMCKFCEEPLGEGQSTRESGEQQGDQKQPTGTPTPRTNKRERQEREVRDSDSTQRNQRRSERQPQRTPTSRSQHDRNSPKQYLSGLGEQNPPQSSQGGQSTRVSATLKNGLVEGVVAGAVAFVVGYALLFLLKGEDMMNNFEENLALGAQSQGVSISELQSAGLELPETWRVTGLAYHGVHKVELSMQVTIPGATEFSLRSPGQFYGGTLSAMIPVVVLLVAGAVVATYGNVGTLGKGAKEGAKIAFGYSLLVGATTIVFTWKTTVSGPGGTVTFELGPELVESFILAGIFYPVGIGAIGGVAGAALVDSASSPATYAN